MKSKILKAGIVVLVLLIIFASLSAYFLKTLAQPENIKKYIIPTVSEYIGKEVSVEDVEIGLFTGISLKGASIKEDPLFGKGDFIKIESAVLNFSFLELLQRKLILKNVYFKEPTVTIIKNAGGKFNFEGMFENSARKEPTEKKRTDSQKREDKEEQPFSLSIQKIIIKDAEILFIDKSTGTEEKQYKVSNLDIAVKGELGEGKLIVDAGAVIDVAGDMGAFPLNIKGSADLKSKNYSFDLKTGEINAYALANALSPQSAEELLPFKNATVKSAVKMNSPDYEKEIKIEGIISFDIFRDSIKIPLSLNLASLSENPDSDFKASVEKASLLTLYKLFPDSQRENKDSLKIKEGNVSGEISYKGKADSVDISRVRGKMLLEKVKCTIPAYNDIPVNVSAEASFDGKKINIKTSDFKIGESVVTLKAESDISGENIDNPPVDATVTFERTSIAAITNLLPESALGEMKSVKIKSGFLSGKMSCKGKSNDIGLDVVSGNINIEEFKAMLADYKNIPVEVSAGVSFERGKIGIKSDKLKIGNSEIALQSSALLPDKKNPLKANISADALLIDADEILESFSPDEENSPRDKKDNVKKEKDSVVPGEDDSSDKDIPLDAVFHITAVRIKYSGMPLSNLKITGEYNNNILNIADMRIDLGNGKVASKDEIHLGKPKGKSKGTVTAEGIALQDLKPLLFSNFKGNARGLISARCDYSAKGTDSGVFKKSLAAKGNFIVKNIELSEVKFLDKTASILGTDDLKNVSFKEGICDFTVEGEEIDYKGFKLTGQKIKITSDGEVKFTGEIKADALLSLSPEISGGIYKGGLLQEIMGNRKGWISVPLKFSGTTDSPKIGLERKAVQKQVVEKGKDALKKELEKILKGNQKKNKARRKNKNNKKDDSINKGLKVLEGFFK